MIRARFENTQQVFRGDFDAVILPLSVLWCEGAAACVREKTDARIFAEIPAMIWPERADVIRRRLEGVRSLGITDAVVENFGAISLAKEFDFTAHGGMFLNILNSVSANEYGRMGLADVTLSFEMELSDMRHIQAEGIGAITYGYLPLMKFRSCPAQTSDGCGKCRGRSELIDRKGERFPIICREKQYSELLNCLPLYIGDKKIPKLDFEELFFTIETPDGCRAVYNQYIKRAAPDFCRTSGLYFRELI